MKATFLLLSLLFAHLVYGQEKILTGFDPKTDLISENYEAGAYLIFDCLDKHWTCVQESYFHECRIKREKDLASEGPYHTCAPIGVLPTKRSCFQRQLFMTGQNYGQRFCIKDKWKDKAVDY